MKLVLTGSRQKCNSEAENVWEKWKKNLRFSLDLLGGIKEVQSNGVFLALLLVECKIGRAHV